MKILGPLVVILAGGCVAWSEVVDACGSQAYYLSLRPRGECPKDVE